MLGAGNLGAGSHYSQREQSSVLSGVDGLGGRSMLVGEEREQVALGRVSVVP